MSQAQLRSLYMVYTFLMKHLHMSFSEVQRLTPDQRKLLISCLREHFQREKEAIEEATKAGDKPQLTKLERKEDYADYQLPTDIRARIQEILATTQKERK